MTLHLKYEANEIALLEGNSNYTNVYLKNGEQLLSSYTLLRHEEKLKGFLRISRSHLVNPEFIQGYKFECSKLYVLLKNGKQLIIPRRRVKEFL